MSKTPTLKILALAGLASLALSIGHTRADTGYYYGTNPNPWLRGPAYPPPPNYYAAMRERLARLEQRQDTQLQRILTGMERGQVTMREAVDLLREHLAIAALERRYLADGRMGPAELAELERRLDEASRHIKFETRDRERDGRHPYPDPWGRR